MLCMNWLSHLELQAILFYNSVILTIQRYTMKTFDTELAMSIVLHSTGGFSYDTLARALISKDKNGNPVVLLESCRAFCLSLEEKGILRRCQRCAHSQDEYFEYIPH